jgi:hypothetical protein
MRKSRLGYGDVEWAIPIDDPVTRICSVAVDDRWVYWAAKEGGESPVLYRMEHNGLALTRISPLPVGCGLTFAEGELFGVDSWPGRLFKIEPDGRSKEIRRLAVDWPYGLAFDGTQLWFLETQGTQPEKRYGAHAIDPKTGEEKAHFMTTNDQISGIAAAPREQGGRLWVSSAAGVVYEIDSAKATTAGKLEAGVLRKFPGHYDQLAWHAGRLWGVDNDAKRICRIRLSDSP